jgi:hypothetical protein
MITSLLTAIGGFGSAAVFLKDIHHLNDPITSSARYLKLKGALTTCVSPLAPL